MAQVTVNIKLIKRLILDNFPSQMEFFAHVSQVSDIDIRDSIRRMYSKNGGDSLSVKTLWAVSQGLSCTIEELLIIK